MEEKDKQMGKKDSERVKGDQIFRGMVSEAHRHTRWGEDDSEQEVVYRMDVENRFNEQCRI